MKKLNKKGFTLIELIVVIAILAILAAILIPAIINYIDQANASRDESNARSLLSEVSLALAVAGDGENVTFTEIPDNCTFTTDAGTTAAGADVTLNNTALPNLTITCGSAVATGRSLSD